MTREHPYPGKVGDDLIGDPVAEVLLAFLGADILEGQDDDRFLGPRVWDEELLELLDRRPLRPGAHCSDLKTIQAMPRPSATRPTIVAFPDTPPISSPMLTSIAKVTRAINGTTRTSTLTPRRFSGPPRCQSQTMMPARAPAERPR